MSDTLLSVVIVKPHLFQTKITHTSTRNSKQSTKGHWKAVKYQTDRKEYSALKLPLDRRKSPWNSTSAMFPDECHRNSWGPLNTVVFKMSMSLIWTEHKHGALAVIFRVCSSALPWEVCVHHDVCRLGVGGVESNVQRLDLDLHWGRAIEEDPAGVVSVGSCWILKGAIWWKQLNVTICRVKINHDETGRRSEDANGLWCWPWWWLLFVFFMELKVKTTPFPGVSRLWRISRTLVRVVSSVPVTCLHFLTNTSRSKNATYSPVETQQQQGSLPQSTRTLLSFRFHSLFSKLLCNLQFRVPDSTLTKMTSSSGRPMDTVQRPLTSLRSTVPDGCRRSCPHGSAETQRGKNKPALPDKNCGIPKCRICARTQLPHGNRGCEVLKDGAGLCWTWRSGASRGLQRRVGVGRSLLAAASRAAALDGDGLGHVHAQHGA